MRIIQVEFKSHVNAGKSSILQESDELHFEEKTLQGVEYITLHDKNWDEFGIITKSVCKVTYQGKDYGLQKQG